MTTTQTTTTARPRQHFDINEVVRVPVTVCESKQARVVGSEWGPSMLRKGGPGWVYLLVEVAMPYGATAWQATEDEIAGWQG